MKKNINGTGNPRRSRKVRKTGSVTIGLNLGDRTSRYCVVGSEGEVMRQGTTATTRQGMMQIFGAMGRCRIALEVGTHSPWVSRLLTELGHEALVANPRRLEAISASSSKDDRVDAEMLARLARADPKLLRPIRHRGEQAQADLAMIRVRAALVESRTKLINTVRGMVKAQGERLKGCDADQVNEQLLADLPEAMRETLQPLVEIVKSLTAKIRESDAGIEQMARKRYPETKLLKQVSGVGTLIATTFVLTVEDKERFSRSRDVGCYVGLRPKRSESGASRPQLRITKEGDLYLRKMLVQGAHHILGYRGPDTDVRRWGLKLAERGGKNAKKRAIVAVARKLGILLHHLWVTGEVYEPLRNSERKRQQQRKAA
ncbi:MAG TPA: IS110 family transposase [Acidobacteriaceae bacterium]